MAVTKNKEARTQALIDAYRGLPGEFFMLKGLICLGTVNHLGEPLTARLDDAMLAARMDEITTAAIQTAREAVACAHETMQAVRTR